MNRAQPPSVTVSCLGFSSYTHVPPPGPGFCAFTDPAVPRRSLNSTVDVSKAPQTLKAHPYRALPWHSIYSKCILAWGKRCSLIGCRALFNQVNSSTMVWVNYRNPADLKLTIKHWKHFVDLLHGLSKSLWLVDVIQMTERTLWCSDKTQQQAERRKHDSVSCHFVRPLSVWEAGNSSSSDSSIITAGSLAGNTNKHNERM